MQKKSALKVENVQMY